MALIRCVGLMILLIGASSAALAQSQYQINQPGTISFGNYTFVMGSCTYQLNGGTASVTGTGQR